MPTYRNVYKYHFKQGNQIVFTGITNDIDRREAELRDEPGQSKQVGLRTTYNAALEWEREQAKQGKLVRKKRRA